MYCSTVDVVKIVKTVKTVGGKQDVTMDGYQFKIPNLLNVDFPRIGREVKEPVAVVSVTRGGWTCSMAFVTDVGKKRAGRAGVALPSAHGRFEMNDGSLTVSMDSSLVFGFDLGRGDRHVDFEAAPASPFEDVWVDVSPPYRDRTDYRWNVIAVGSESSYGVVVQEACRWVEKLRDAEKSAVRVRVRPVTAD